MKRILLLSALVLTLAACSNSASGPNVPNTPPAINITGDWYTFTKTADGQPQNFDLKLTQTGGSVGGTAQISYYMADLYDLFEDFGSASGAVGGDQFDITATGQGKYAGASVRLTGTCVPDTLVKGRGKLQGNFTASGKGKTFSGTFSAYSSSRPTPCQ